MHNAQLMVVAQQIFVEWKKKKKQPSGKQPYGVTELMQGFLFNDSYPSTYKEHHLYQGIGFKTKLKRKN